MNSLILTRSEARKIILHAAGLARPAQFGTGIQAVYNIIDHLGFVQLDTNFVVERAHHHVMAARVPDYRKEWLTDLCEDGSIFEYFTSDAGFLPMHEFRFSLPTKESFAVNGKPLTSAEIELQKALLNRIERDGPLMLADIEDDRLEASSGWWDWRPAKIALERLYLEGKLVVNRTKTFQKVYDLPINLVPQETGQTMPTPQEYARYVIGRTLGALGIGYLKEIMWRARRVKGNDVKKELAQMVEEGAVRIIEVEGLKSAPLYMLSNHETDVHLSGDVFILSPFDILNVFRHRLKDFFEFDYQIECFVPAPKRKYGYFSLPILAGDRFIARMDAKADRKEKIFIVHNLHFEHVKINKLTIEKFSEALKAFVAFNQCRNILFNKTNNDNYLKMIVRDLE